jgi:hypothetical protein
MLRSVSTVQWLPRHGRLSSLNTVCITLFLLDRITAQFYYRLIQKLMSDLTGLFGGTRLFGRENLLYLQQLKRLGPGVSR